MFYDFPNFSFTYVMGSVSHRMAPFYPQMILFGVATKGVVFCGTVFTWWHVAKVASGCIMVGVDPTVVAVLI